MSRILQVYIDDATERYLQHAVSVHGYTVAILAENAIGEAALAHARAHSLTKTKEGEKSG